MQQKVIQIGNSSGIILPQLIRQQIGIKPGDNVEVNTKGRDIIISASRKKKTGGVNLKFAKMLDEFIIEHDDVLQELAKR